MAGKAEVSHRAHKIGELVPGQFIGEVGFICKEPRSATVTASTDIALMLINAEDFRRLPSRIRESIKDRIISGLVERVSGMNDNIIRYDDEIDELKEKIDEYESESDSRFKGRASVLNKSEGAPVKADAGASKQNKRQAQRDVTQAATEQESSTISSPLHDADSDLNADSDSNADSPAEPSQSDQQNSSEQQTDPI